MNTFDRDLGRGKQIEQMFLELLHQLYPLAYIVEGYFKDYDIYIPEIKKSVEVKSDEKSKHTGNIVVEVEFNNKPSALSTTKADYWVWYDGINFTIITPQEIKRCIKETNQSLRSFIAKGDDKEKKAYLIKKELLWQYSLKHIEIKN